MAAPSYVERSTRPGLDRRASETYLSEAAVAERWHVSPKIVRRLTQEGRLRQTMVRRARRYALSDVLAYEAAQVRGAPVADLSEQLSFYFRGPASHLNLRAQNLRLFLELGAAVDDETWLYHLRRGDYAAWFQDTIQDAELAAETRALAQRVDLTADESRAALAELIARRYAAAVVSRSPN